MALSLNPLKWFSGAVNKASTLVQQSIKSVMTVKWSYAARRASTAYSELFHTSPRLDAVDIIATDCANAEFKIYRKVDRRKGKSEMEPVYDHPAYDLLENPVPGRPDFDGFILRYLTEVYCEIHGECFWILVRDARGIPRECYVIPTTWMITTPSVSQPKYLMMPLGNTSSASILLDPEDVIWHKNPDAVQPYARGRGRTEAIGDQLETSEYADKWQKNFFFNDATPRTVMTMVGANDEQIKAFKAAWNQEFRSVSNASKTGFVGWDAKLLTLGTSPKEMDFTESLKAIADVCRQHYQIPPEIFGILDNSNRSTIDAARYLYAVNVLTKRFKRREGILTSQLLPMYGSDDFFLQFENPVQEDREFELKVLTEGFKLGTIDVDEWRVGMGMKAWGGEVGKSRGLPKPDPESKPGEEPEEELEEPVALPEPEVKPKAKTFRVLRKKLTEEELAALWARFDEMAKQAELPFVKSMKEVSKAQKAQFKALFEGYVGEGLDPEQSFLRATVEIYGVEAVNTALFKKLAPAWAKAIRNGYDVANDILGGGVNWRLYREEFAKWVTDHGLEAAKEINGTTKEELLKLRPVVVQGIKDGWSADQVSAKLMSVYDKLGKSRADLIARTETMMTLNHGSFSVYAKEGVKKKQWLHFAGQRDFREAHAALGSSDPIPINEPFMVNGIAMMYPGDPAGGADENANCSCSLAPVFEDE